MLDFEGARLLFSKGGKDETNLHAWLRHIRNSLAHGHLYIYKKEEKVCFLVDYNSHNASAKIMVTSKILEGWKAILENQIAIGE